MATIKREIIMNKRYIYKNMRISLLEDEILRFEYVPTAHFSNQETLFTAQKKELNFSLDIHEEERIWFKYQDLVVVFDYDDPFRSLEIYQNDRRVYRFRMIRNSGELPLPNKTPFIYPVMDTPRIIVPYSGYSTEENYIYEVGTKDLFLLVARNDYKKLRKQIISLTGNNDMPRLKTFGLFNSRYYKWNDKSAREMIKKYHQNKIPLDNFVLDTDWRDQGKLKGPGVGYDINKELFPDLIDFFRFAHDHNVEVMMNDHPHPLMKKYNVFSKEEIAFRKDNLTRFLTMGLDSWWYDRNWWTKLISPSKRVPVETLGRYLYHDITKQFYEGFVLDPEAAIRPVTLSNITEIRNGRYQGIKDSRSHIYPFQWTGDISSESAAITNEVTNLNKAVNSMIAYYSSDIGGHTSNPTRSEFIRWYQYGAFSPILRPHCTNSVVRFREPWVFGEKTFNIVKEYIYMRYRLLNVIYREAYKNYNEGLGIFRPLYLNYPEDKKVYKENQSYMLGNDILVRPLGGEPLHEMKQSFYKGVIYASFFAGKELKGKALVSKKLKNIGFSIMDEPLYEEVPLTNFSARYKFRLKPDQDIDLYIASDDGIRVYIDNKLIFNDWKDHAPVNNYIVTLKAHHLYKMRLEYYQALGGASLNLSYCSTSKNKKTKIYLPEGEWYNVTHRNVYQGKRYIKEKYALEELPLFVRAGALLPLYKNVDNISKMSLKNVIYDYYPSRDKANEDYIYEDDGITSSYHVGVNRISRYKSEYKDNYYQVTFYPSEDNLDEKLDARNAMFKMHVRDKEKVTRVTINDVDVRFKRHDHNKKIMPFSSSEWARDSKTMCFKFRQETKKKYVVKIYVEE